MKIKNDLKLFIQTVFISTVVFFVFGNIIFKGLLNYGEWTVVFFTVHIILTFIVMTPLLIVFRLLDKIQNTIPMSVYIRVGLRSTIGTLYITTLLWFSIFSDTKQRLNSPFNYYEDLKYLGLYTLINILIFIIIDYYHTIKNKE